LLAAFGWNGLLTSGRRAVLGFTGGGGRWLGLTGRRRIVACTAGFLWRSGTALGEGDVALGVLYDLAYVHGVPDGAWDMSVTRSW
jgi:hypothetical protein